MSSRIFPPQLLEAVLRDAPFALNIVRASDKAVFANGSDARMPRSSANGDGAAEGFRQYSFASVVDGERFDIRLTLDNAAEREREQELLRLALFDDLTGLPNHTMLAQVVAAEINAGAAEPFALAILDLDGFQKINEYYGVDTADRLVVAIAERLSSCLGEAEILAYGSDAVFGLFMPRTDQLAAEGHLGEILKRMKSPFHVDGVEIFCSVSGGACLFPRDGASYRELHAAAAGALDRAKSANRGQVEFTVPHLSGASNNLTKVEQRLRLALRDNRFCCAYQPKVAIATGKLVGVEVLLRWYDDDGMVRSPGDFVSIATDRGIINDIAYGVLDEILDSIDQIDVTFGEHASISLNVVAKQACDEIFMREFIHRITSGGAAHRFVLEVTEEAFFSASVFRNTVLPMVREAGLRVSIDDFGTGYSSLAALAEFTPDELKIDRVFVTDLPNRSRSQAIIETIDKLGAALGINIVAEGVETKDELDYLAANTGIGVAQGFFLGKPLVLERPRDVTAHAKIARQRENPRQIAARRTAE
ncbi:MAG: bifunctional diguanylate cyclase/phosphodiesterase [Rhizobiaceae bacterium]|nr:bifunctional diguanylate cyclase/phosphodiesterase [Rhizobiaceae bacterium]